MYFSSLEELKHDMCNAHTYNFFMINYLQVKAFYATLYFCQ